MRRLNLRSANLNRFCQTPLMGGFLGRSVALVLNLSSRCLLEALCFHLVEISASLCSTFCHKSYCYRLKVTKRENVRAFRLAID